MSKAVKDKRGKIRIRIPLNSLALGVALGGILVPLLMQSPVHFASDAESMLAGAGSALSASVPPNPYNTLAQQLKDKEDSLNERQAELDAREVTAVGPSAGEIFGFLSFVFSVILFALIGLNFYMDSHRSKKPVVSSKFSVDLR